MTAKLVKHHPKASQRAVPLSSNLQLVINMLIIALKLHANKGVGLINALFQKVMKYGYELLIAVTSYELQAL